MFLRSLELKNFKNYSDVKLEFCEHINCLVGLNGSGKTNILDAIHYLSLTKSHFNTIDNQNIRDAEPFFVVNGEVNYGAKAHQVHCSLKRGEKKLFQVDGSEYEKMSQHLGKVPIVLIAPDDDELIRDVSEVRRKFFDSTISQTHREYLNRLIGYNYQLKQRNALLKKGDQRAVDLDLLSTYDDVLISEGKWLALRRKDFVEEFEPRFESNYALIAEKKERVRIVYKSKALEESFAEQFLAGREKDLVTQRTNVGIHRDDYQFVVDDRPVKKFGSQGQQKSFLVSLKFAQFEFMKNHLGLTPILLLDDIFDKLDDGRITQMLKIIASDQFKQIFITDAREERTMSLINNQFEPLRIFRIENGQVDVIE